MPRYPNPDGQKVTRHKPAFTWTALPASGRKGDPPELPGWRGWHEATLTWWRALWATPQATQWREDGRSLHPLAVLMDDVHAGRTEMVRASGEIRQHEDRHGLSPKAMLQLRWKVEEDEEDAAGAPPPRATSRYAHLRAVKDAG